MKKILAFAMAALALVACKKNQDATSVTGIKLDQEAITIKVGEAQELKATIQPEGAKATIAWESSAPGVAKVTAGLVAGVSAGTAYIIATAEVRGWCY